MTVELNEQRKKVFLDRYARKNDSGVPVERTPEEMWVRVAKAIGDNSEEHLQFASLLADFKFVPGGRILAGAGVGTEQTFYNCYVIPVEPKPSTTAYRLTQSTDMPPVGNDSRESIFDTIATMVDIMSRGGGVGINWSTLRPSGSYLSRVSGTSSGPVGWMDVASKAVGEVEQGGSRRGAAMFMLDDWHPDILNFIEAKRDFNKITNANVSVAVSDRFMEAVRLGAGWQLEFPNTSEPDYNTEWDGDLEKWRASGRGISIYRSLPARQIWDALVASAHASGEPGVVFLDRYNRESTGRDVERIISVNPCGEQGLGAYSVCNLGSMNLAAYVDAGQPDGFNWTAFGRDTRTAVRFLDNVIDKSFYWDDRSRQRQQDLRRIGLGVMGLADALIRLGIRYGSGEAVKFTENVFQLMKDEAIEASIFLAEEKGPAKAYSEDMWARPYLREYVSRRNVSNWDRKPLRNLFFLTQAPTGTTSILAGVNSGIEPYFAFEYTRKDRTGTHKVVADLAKDYIDTHDGTYSVGLPDYFVTSNDVTVEQHIKMQAAVQKYVDSSVSKTINGPNSHTIKDVDKAYRMAYDAGLKGLAYFRDGSGRDQVLYKDSLPTAIEAIAAEQNAKLIDKNNALEDKIALLEETIALGPKAEGYRRPERVSGVTSRLNTSMGTMYLTVNRDDETGQPVEIFVNVGKAGSDVMALGEAIGRLVSTGLQWGIPLNKVADQLVGVGGTSNLSPGLVHAIGKALANSQGDGSAIAKAAYPAPVTNDSYFEGEMCPECTNLSLVREEGCEKCNLCGFSRC